MMMIKCVLLLALLTQCVKSLKSSVELRQMMEMEVSMFLNKANRMTFEMADNVHPSELDRTEDLQSYLNKVQSSVEDNVPELDKSHALIDMIGHSMRHQVFEKIHSFVEIAESLRGVCTSRPTVTGTSASKADIKELQGMLEKKGHNPGAIDGLWGAKTKAAVKAFQTASGLSPVDGIAGKDTWNALCGASSGGSSSSGSGSSSHNNDAKPEHAATVSRSTEGGRAVIDAARGLRDFLRSAKEGYGTTFNGYGSGQYQYVCTTYVSKVLRNVGYPFSKGDDVDGMINIRGLNLPSDKDAASKKLGELVLAGEELTKGVVHALVIKKWGTEVTDLDTVQPGDLCQYWYGSKANLGHVVIIDTVLNQGHKVKVIGSHGSKKGVDFLNVNLHTMKKAYCVKPHAVDTEGSVRNEIEDDNDDPSGVAGLPTPEEEMVEDMKAHAAECKKCKANIKPDDGDPNQACSNECSVTSKDVNSENFLEDIAKNFFNGITRLHSGDTCKKFTMSWECMNAYFPHMVIIGASGNAGPVVGGAEVVTDYNAGEVGIFLYGGLTVGTGMFGVSRGFYAGVGYKGDQSEACCKNSQDFGTKCIPDQTKKPCPLRDSYKGYFLGGDISAAVPPFGAGVIVAMSAGAVFEDADLDDIGVFKSSLVSDSGDILDTSLSRVGDQAGDLVDGVMDSVSNGPKHAAIQALKAAGCFVTKPLPHLTKTIAFTFETQAKEVAVGVNLATTHYKHVGSMQCWERGPACFAASLAISPPWDFPPNFYSTPIKVIGFAMFMNKWCDRHGESVTCKIWDTLKDMVATAIDKIAKLIKSLQSKKFGEALGVVWDQAMQNLATIQREINQLIAESKERADKWVAENIGKDLNNLRKTFGDVSPEEKENVVILPSEFVGRDGTYFKILDCKFDNNEGFGPDGWDWDSEPTKYDLKSPYWTCKACSSRERTCSSSRNTEIGFKQTGVGHYAWRPNEASDMERGFGMFFDGGSRSFVDCYLNNRIRVGESVMSLLTLGDDENLPNTRLWMARGSIEKAEEADVMKMGDDGNFEQKIGTCRYLYYNKRPHRFLSERGGEMLRHNKN